MSLASDNEIKYKWTFEIKDSSINLTKHGHPAFIVEVVTPVGHIHIKGVFAKAIDALSMVDELEKNPRHRGDRVHFQVVVFNSNPNGVEKMIGAVRGWEKAGVWSVAFVFYVFFMEVDCLVLVRKDKDCFFVSFPKCVLVMMRANTRYVASVTRYCAREVRKSKWRHWQGACIEGGRARKSQGARCEHQNGEAEIEGLLNALQQFLLTPSFPSYPHEYHIWIVIYGRVNPKHIVMQSVTLIRL